jgi:hypothetical protein
MNRYVVLTEAQKSDQKRRLKLSEARLGEIISSFVKVILLSFVQKNPKSG